MGKIDYLTVNESLVPLSLHRDFIGSTWIKHSEYISVFLLKVVDK